MSAPDAKAIVVQFGGRRQYAVPAVLARSGRLEALYTDLCAGRGIGRLAPLATRLPYLSGKIDFSKRTPPPEVLSRTRAFPSWFVGVRRAARMHGDVVERVRRLMAADQRASRKMIRAGLGNSTHVLCMFGEGMDFLRAAHEAGKVTLVDMNVAPSAEAIVRAEQQRHAGWEPPGLFHGESLRGELGFVPPMQATIDVTTRFLCPSLFVRDDLVENYGIAPERIRVAPYAVNPKWLSVVPRPEQGRILFAGGASLRKGVHVFARAMSILRARGRNYRFLVAGSVAQSIRARPEVAGMEFLGHVSSAVLREEYARADLLALPSLAEGSAGVTYEALGCALPVVTTHESGSVVRDGQDGLIVPSRDAEALADAIDRVVSDRDLRARMSASAREHARGLTWDRYERRLIDGVFEL